MIADIGWPVCAPVVTATADAAAVEVDPRRADGLAAGLVDRDRRVEARAALAAREDPRAAVGEALAEDDPGVARVVLGVDVGQVGGAGDAALEVRRREVLRRGGQRAAEHLARVDVAGLAPRHDADAVGGDRDARAAAADAGRAAPGRRRPAASSTLQAFVRRSRRATRTSPADVNDAYAVPLIDMSTAGSAPAPSGVGADHARAGRAHDAVDASRR